MSYVTRNFAVDFLMDEIEVGWTSDKVVLREVVGQHRWSVLYRVIFEHENQLWEIEYNEPATEMQEGQDRFWSDPVEARQVETYEKTVTGYRPVKAEN